MLQKVFHSDATEQGSATFSAWRAIFLVNHCANTPPPVRDKDNILKPFNLNSHTSDHIQKLINFLPVLPRDLLIHTESLLYISQHWGGQIAVF